MTSNEFDVDGILLVATVSTLVAALGAGIDKLLRDHQRNMISERLFHWWERIERMNIPNIAPTIARLFIGAEQSAFGDRILSIRWIATTIAISALLTTSTILIGDYAYYFRSWSKTLKWFPNYYPLIIYPANYFFDFCTLAFTVAIMRVAAKSGSMRACVLILIDIVIAFVFAVSAYILISDIITSRAIPSALTIFSCCPLDMNFDRVQTIFQYYLGDTSEYFWPFRLLDEVATPMAGAPSEGGWLDRHPAYGGRMGRNLFSNTSLIPTIAYLLLFLLAISSLATVRGIRWIFLHLLALDIETGNSIFLYSGALVGVVATSFKLVVELSRWWFVL